MSSNDQLVVVEKEKDKEYWIYINGCVDNDFDEKTSPIVEKIVKTDDKAKMAFHSRLHKRIDAICEDMEPEYGVDWIYLKKEMNLKLPYEGFWSSKPIRMNEYNNNFVKQIKDAVIEAIRYPEKARLDKSLEDIINKIYEDGFEDAKEEKE